MDDQIKQIVDFTKMKFGLKNYELNEYEFYRKVNIYNETIYTLSMEWLPNNSVQQDDLNPDGTAVIEMNLNTQKFEQVIFVNGKSYAENDKRFLHYKEIIKWIEEETGLTYEDQFQLEKEEEGKFTFHSSINGIKVAPIGCIEIQFNHEGQLIEFSINGQFPEKKLIKEEIFTLSREKLENLYFEQLRLIETPIFEQKKRLPIYALDEIYVTNSGIPIEMTNNQNVKIDQLIYWDEPLNQPFKAKKLDWFENITSEQAFSCEPSPESYSITEHDKEQCLLLVKNFLRQQYSKDSGQWVLQNLYREKKYIVASLYLNKQDHFIFKRKMKVFINGRNFQVENYIDSAKLLETFNDFQAADGVTFTKEQAFEKLKSNFELKPYYVYDPKERLYVLCGKLDCHFAVNATNGEVVALNEL